MPCGRPIKSQQLQTVPVSDSEQDYYRLKLAHNLKTSLSIVKGLERVILRVITFELFYTS